MTRAGSGPVVDVRDAFCLYPVPGGAVAALRGLTLTVAVGERVVVHGPNGSGKTTLLRVLAGQQQLSAGRAEVAGLEVGRVAGAGAVADARARWRATQLGWIDQHPWRMLRPELDVLANVALQQRLAGVAARAAAQAARELLDRLGVAQLARRRPGTLSGGEAQRVAVCAALAHRPRLVLADEPTGELDAVSATGVYDAIAAAVRDVGAALVLVSHDRGAARVADRVVRIRDGRLSETWTPTARTEQLVVDDRGWVRLPELLRAAAGAGDAVRAEVDGGSIVLRPVCAAGPGPVAGPPATGPTMGSPRRSVPCGRPAVRAREVGKAYGSRMVLAGVDVAVPAGRMLVVRGRSGAGKSTLLRVLVGLERPDAGQVRLADTDLSGLDRSGTAAVRRAWCAVVGQDVHLAETVDVVANLQLAQAVRGVPAHDPAPVLRALDLVGLAGRQVRLLSGGERQRVAVARALVVRPALVVLDEPTSQLDEASAESLAGVLAAVARAGAAVVVASHDPVVVAAADTVLDLEGDGAGP